MTVNQLHVQNYRNISRISLIPDPLLTVIAGDNGQGKTNFLESIWLLTGSKSFRSSKDFELVSEGQPMAAVEGIVEDLNTDKSDDNLDLSADNNSYKKEIKIQIYSREGERKGRFAKVNGVDFGRAAAIAGQFTAVVFEPGHLSLVKGSPEGRRKFLDAALCQLYPGYLAILRRFAKALSQKNALLRRHMDYPDAHSILDAYDAEIVTSGEEITKRRREYLHYVGHDAENFYTDLTQKREKLEIRFQPCCEEGKLSDLLRNRRANDLRAGFSTAGPQREDFEAIVNGRSARVFGSQGQQRSVVLSLKLAEAARVKQVTGDHPVMLLDDVLSELDTERQSYLLGEMEGKQTFVTTCDEGAYQRAGGKIVRIKSGIIID